MFNWRLNYIFFALIISLGSFIIFGLNIALIITPVMFGIFLYSSFTILKIFPASIKKHFGIIIAIANCIFAPLFFMEGNDKLFVFLLWAFMLAALSTGFLFYKSRATVIIKCNTKE